IRNLQIDANGANNNGEAWIGISAHYARRWQIEGCRIHSIASNQNRAIRTFSILTTTCEDVVIASNHIGPGGDYDMVSVRGGSSKVRVTGNRIVGEGIASNGGICIQCATSMNGDISD